MPRFNDFEKSNLPILKIGSDLIIAREYDEYIVRTGDTIHTYNSNEMREIYNMSEDDIDYMNQFFDR